MVHSQRPLQEKMTLFWHNHFATAYSKVAGAVGAVQATKMMALKSGELPGPQGQIELSPRARPRQFSKPARSRSRKIRRWSCGSTAGRTSARALRRTSLGKSWSSSRVGVGNYTEEDVYAAARVFTGWNLRNATGGVTTDPATYYEFFYNPNQHDLTAKTFTFPIYRDGGRTIPARAAADGMQDGFDLLTALARHPETARRLARKLWNFFVSELEAPDPAFVDRGRERVPAERDRDEARCAVHPAVSPGFSIRTGGTRGIRGRSSSSCERFVRWGGTGFRSIRRARR